MMWSKAVHGGATRFGTAAGAGPRSLRTASAVLLVLVVVVGASAHGQGVNAVVVTNNPLSFPSFTTYSDLGDAVADAISSAIAAYQHYDVLVDTGTWTESLSIPSDADITIQGIAGPAFGTSSPPAVVIQSTSAMLDVIEMYTPADPSGATPTGRFVVEGVTLTGGRHGVYNSMPGPGPTLNRVYIRDNANSGVLCENGAQIQLVNCSIANNGVDGVSVDSFAIATIYYCSIIRNLRAGVFVYSDNFDPASATVANTLIFENAQSGLEWTVAPFGAPTLENNDVFMNPDTVSNYVNVSAGPGSQSGDPLLWEDTYGDSPWTGALAASRNCYEVYDLYLETAPSPVIDLASLSFVLAPYTSEDFYGDPRPVAFPFPTIPAESLPDIGADEVVCSLTFAVPTWSECVVTPNPLGKSAVGDAQIQIRLDPYLEPNTFEVFVVPQGGDINLDRIPFNIDSSTLSGTYYYTNAVAIDTLVRDADGVGGTDVTIGDIIADGHAQVYIELLDIPGTILGFNDNTSVTGQAVTGRHFILDTTPPRMVLTYGLNPAGLAANEIVSVLNASFDYTTGGAEASTHPAVPTGVLQATDPFPVLVADASHDGLITDNPAAGAILAGTHMFINVGSLSNGSIAVPHAPENLGLVVAVQFEDPLPHTTPTTADPDGVPFLDRVVAGFVDSGTFDTFGTPNNAVAQWSFAAGGALMNLVTATCVYVTGGTNVGFNPTSPSDETFDYANSVVNATWSFRDDTSGVTVEGLDWSKAEEHASIQFRPLDRAGNGLDFTELSEPLHLWWMTTAAATLTPNYEGNDNVPDPAFDLRLIRPEEPQVARTAPLSLFSYRIYSSPFYAGPYLPVTGWSAWLNTFAVPPGPTPQLVIDPNDPALAGTGGQWLLLVVLGADEAGNVQPWPDGELGTNTEEPIPLSFSSAGNWQRFKIGIGNLDTSLQWNFWWDRQPYDGVIGLPDPSEANFGSQTIIPSPPDFNNEYVAGQFRATITSDLLADCKIYFELLRGDGSLVTSGTMPQTVANSGVVIFNLPPLAGGAPGFRLEDEFDPRQPQYYVLRVWAFVDGENLGVLDPDDPIDPTPASVAFTVVPQSSIESYVRNRESLDRQPVKVQEEQ